MKKMIGKRDKFRAIPKNSECWSRGDDGRQGVPEALPATGNARSPAVDSRVRRITSCEDDDDRRRRWLESTTRWM